MKSLSCSLLVILIATAAHGQDLVTYRDRALLKAKAPRLIKGKIESESLAGIKIDGQTIAAADVVDVKYEAPGQVSYDLPKAVAAETAQNYDEAIKEYRGLIATAAAPNWSALRRHFEFKIVLSTAAKAEAAGDAKPAVETAESFIKQYPDCWQRVPATNLLVRLYLDRSPPDTASAWKTLDAVTVLSQAPAELKADLALSAVDIALGHKNWDEARRRLAAVPPGDARLALYQIACSDATDRIEKLTAAAESGEERLRPTAYNLLGDVYRADPKRQKDALFAYLWVDVVYDRDPRETAKAREQLAVLFKEMKDDARARQYRAKARGQ